MCLKEKIVTFKNFITDYSSRELKILVNLFILVTAVLVFALVAKEVVQGETQKFDELVLNSLRSGETEKLPIKTDKTPASQRA